MSIVSTAEARDAAGNLATASVAVTVRNTPVETSPHFLEFDGVNDYVQVADAPALSFGNGAADTPLTIEKAAALAGLIQCIARWLTVDRPFEPQEDDYLPYTFNRFQACRFGLDGVFVDPGSGEQRVLRDDLLMLLGRLEPHAHVLRAEAALALVRSELAGSGNDASWIRRTIDDERLLPEVVRQQTLRWAGRSTA